MGTSSDAVTLDRIFGEYIHCALCILMFGLFTNSSHLMHIRNYMSKTTTPV